MFVATSERSLDRRRFDPPGMISAGMSCYLHVTFAPKVNRCRCPFAFPCIVPLGSIKINENLQGEIKFLAQTGMFTVPIRCEIKRVEVTARSRVSRSQSEYCSSRWKKHR